MLVADTPKLAVIRLSESFGELWPVLAGEAGAQCDFVTADSIPDADVLAVLLAAGGEEDNALDVLLSMRRRNGVPVYLVGARSSHRFAVAALRRGAADYFALPDDVDLLRRTIASRFEALEERTRRSGGVAAPMEAFRHLLGESAALRKSIDRASRIVAHGDVTVLIGGETGTGKELLARALHEGGPRSRGPFVAVNCAAIPNELLESELFGHVRGAFTSAHHDKAGLFEEAGGGTLFLDETGQLPLHLQGKLLRVLEDKQVRRVGSNEYGKVDVRIIAATHTDLALAVKRGEFREDLFHRLNVVNLMLPPLRERGDDIELLASSFMSSLAQRYGLPVPKLTPAVRATLRDHTWPGNVRELRHAVERALLLSDPGTLDPAELIPKALTIDTTTESLDASGTLAEILTRVARRARERHGGNQTAAARSLGISRARLARLLAGSADDLQ